MSGLGTGDVLARLRGRLLALVATVALTAALAVLGGASSSSARQGSAGNPRPNVIVIETDDQTVESMKVMSNVRSLIADAGVTFPESFVNFPLCCPSRATFLTGEYAHNHGVLSNHEPLGGFTRFQHLHRGNNLAVWLQRAGYYTGLIGKYLNEYGKLNQPQTPRGWSWWQATSKGTTGLAYDYTMIENGNLVDYADSELDFKQDVLTQDAVDFVDRRAPKLKPFFLWLTYTAPHTGGPSPNPQPPSDCESAAKPAPRHADAFDDEPLPLPPSFNETDVSDKPKAIQALPLLDSGQIADLRRIYRCSLESLLSVDEGVGRVIGALEASGELGRTYVFFTSDNGYFNGEHRIPEGKSKAYEESVRVPLVMRGPGIPQGAKVRDLVINADLAPTIARIARAEPRLTFDGRSLLGAARHPKRETGRELELESQNFKAIRTQRYVYVVHGTGEKELYDLKRDPYELQSQHANPAYAKVRRRLARRLQHLRHCEGRTCLLRPRLDLEIHHRELRRHGHKVRGCAHPPIRATLTGKDARNVVKAEFYVDGRRVAVDTHAPFEHRARRVEGKTRLGVRATLNDGRRMTLERRIRVCRGG